jgi:ribosomal protein S18 acetylase RimI-like enzyme
MDMLVKLYDLDDDWYFIAEQKSRGVTIRKPIGPEKHLIIEWVAETFGPAWAAETDAALGNRPWTCFAAVKEEAFIGFACYDATALGFFGPIGVAPSHRGNGTGKALLLACLLDMKLKGYGYAMLGAVKDTEFFKKTASAVEIPDSTPGFYRNRVREPKADG